MTLITNFAVFSLDTEVEQVSSHAGQAALSVGRTPQLFRALEQLVDLVYRVGKRLTRYLKRNKTFNLLS